MKTPSSLFLSTVARVTIVGLLFGAMPQEASAQIARLGKPLSKRFASSCPTVELPATDLRPFLEEDAQQIPGRPRRFGIPAALDLSPSNAGIWTEQPDGDRVWRLRLRSPGAFSINLIFDSFELGPENELFIYNDDRSMVLGAFSEHNNSSDGVFATQPVKGDAITLELRQPRDVRPGVFRITQLVHAYRDLFPPTPTSSSSQSGGSCFVDVNCPPGTPYQDHKSAVGMLIMGGGQCTGALISKTRQDQDPLFLTANHCFEGGGSPSSWIVWFNYEATTCGGTAGPLTDSVSGATLLSRSAESDYCLVRLNSKVPTSYHPYWIGYARTAAVPTSSAGISHPAGAPKKIHLDNHPAVSLDAYSMKLWRLNQLEVGAMQGGSSGSPLLDQNLRIVGQLYGYIGSPGATCVTNDLIYGRLETSWMSGANVHLDPDNLQYPTTNGYQGVDPNLRAVSISGPSTATTGQTVTVTRNVESYGWPYSGPFTYRIRLSSNSSITESDPLVFQATTSGYGSENCPAFSLPASITAGTWYWGLEIVPVPGESQTLENVVAGGTCVVTPGPTDLVAGAVSGPASATAGATVSVSRTITNDGAPFSGSVVIDYILSADTIISTSDLIVSSATISSLGTATDSFVLPASVPDGSWYWGLRVRSVTGETNTSNNVKAGGAVMVTQVPKRIPLDGGVFGTISSSTDIDRGRFFGIANMGFKIRANSESMATSVSIEVRPVSASDGTYLGILSPSSGNTWLSTTLATTGEYELVVRPAGGTGEYSLLVDANFANVPGSFTRKLAASDGSTQSFKFTVIPGSIIDVFAKANKKLKGNGLGGILVSPSGIALDVSSAMSPVGSKGFEIDYFLLPEAGEYELKITGIKGKGKPVKLTVDVHQGPDGAGTPTVMID